MKNKGQVGVGAIIVAFIGIIVGLIVVFQGTSPAIGTLTETAVTVNQTFTFPAAGGTFDLNGQSTSGIIVSNRTGQQVIPATNYTITNNVVTTDGRLVSRLTANTGVWNSIAVNASYTYEPYGYQTNTGNRAVVDLIPIFAAIAVALIALAAAFSKDLLNLLDI